VKSGVYSRSGRILSSRAAEIADAIMSVTYVREPDEFAAAEVGFTPRGRADLVSTIARAGLAAEIARRRGQPDGN
jgi:hypothetical protein